MLNNMYIESSSVTFITKPASNVFATPAIRVALDVSIYSTTCFFLFLFASIRATDTESRGRAVTNVRNRLSDVEIPIFNKVPHDYSCVLCSFCFSFLIKITHNETCICYIE